ncbi:hypothetical protein ACFFS2_10380 [Streptomyces aurantiacus]|nr:hypothetical protein [Streptomyces aurantiacus]
MVAQLAGAAMVAAMGADAWQQTRGAVIALWRRVHPEQAEAVEGESSGLRTVLRGADGELAAAALTQLWQMRLRAPSPAAPRVGSVRMSVRATDGGRVHQSAGDLHVTEN